MARIFGFDIGTTSIGFAVIDHDPQQESGRILRMGTRIFPEARDPDGTPLNQGRRQKRMVRRQLRRRRQRRRLLNETLSEAGLLPKFDLGKDSTWATVMRVEPLALRNRGLLEALTPYELGRAIYHLAQRRHFKGRELEESSDDGEADDSEKEAKTEREATLQALKKEKLTLGAWLAKRGPHERKRGIHAHRSVVEEEFEKLWTAQSAHHPILRDDQFKARVHDAIFAQRPVFWRKNTLGECRFMPGEALCPKGAWLSQQRRMLEKLNNLAIASGNARPLDEEERAAILAKLQTQASMSWAGVRAALRPLFKARGEPGAEKSLKFNLEFGGEKKLLGNGLEAKLVKIFGPDWDAHPHKQAIRDAVHQRLWLADYGEIGEQRVVILSAPVRRKQRAEAAESFIRDFGITREQAAQLETLTFPAGWEPYSIEALRAMLPQLEAGIRFGALVNGPEWEAWRDATFPDRDRPTGEILDRLPSPASREEQHRIRNLRNPTVARIQNELRKVVNNLIGLYGKPDLIRIELAREVGLSKRRCEEMQAGIRKQEARRRKAIKDLEENGITTPARKVVEKWLLWKESRERCPYTGDQIGFDALFGETRYEVEHIWPRSRCFDNGFRNKTLCRRDVNIAKGNRTPFEFLGHDETEWAAIQSRLWGMVSSKGGDGMRPTKVKRFLARSIPEGFASRQLNDTGYAARQAREFLQRLWPDIGPNAPVTVQAVTGRVTAQLRSLWGLNYILAEDGEKSRADHRHHAIDALVVACAHPGMTNRLSRYWQHSDDPRAEAPELPPPWPTIRVDADRAAADIVVSHRVRRKVSGPLHKETTYGDTGEDVTRNRILYRVITQRVPIADLSQSDLMADDLESAKTMIRDQAVRNALREHVSCFDGDIKKAMASELRLGPHGPVIRKVRVVSKRQISGMVAIHNGLSDPENKHHIAVYRNPNGDYTGEIVSLIEAARRIAKRQPIVSKKNVGGAKLVMSLAKGEIISFKDDRALYWVVRELKSNGQITLVPHTEARPTKQGIVYKPTIAGLMRQQPTKVSVDPIGRLRKAND